MRNRERESGWLIMASKRYDMYRLILSDGNVARDKKPEPPRPKKPLCGIKSKKEHRIKWGRGDGIWNSTSLDASGFEGEETYFHVPQEIMNKARNSYCDVDLLALGKPGGDIFNPDHWMYERTRDHFCDIIDFRLGMFT